MKLFISILVFILFSFGCNVFAGSPYHAQNPDLSFIDRLSPEGSLIYVGKVVAIEKPWLSNNEQLNIQIDAGRYLVGGGKFPVKRITLKGQFPDLVKNQTYIFACSPPSNVVAIIPFNNNPVLIERIMTKVNYVSKKEIIVDELSNIIFDKLKPKWHEARIYQKDRTFYREYDLAEYSSSNGTVQFILGSTYSYKEPYIIFNAFDVKRQGNEKLTISGLVMPGETYFQAIVNYKDGGYVQLEEFKIINKKSEQRL